jgi:hypothetical protein
MSCLPIAWGTSPKASVNTGESIMIARIIAPTLTLATLLLPAAQLAVAAEAVDGTVESAGSGKISIKDKSGKVHNFEVDDSAKITLDGKTAKLDEIGVGSSASVTTETKSSKTIATMIMAKSKLHLADAEAARSAPDRPRPYRLGKVG